MVPSFRCTFLPDMPYPPLSDPGEFEHRYCPVSRCRRGLRRDLTGSTLPIIPQSNARGAQFRGFTGSQLLRPVRLLAPLDGSDWDFVLPQPPKAFAFQPSDGSVAFPAAGYHYDIDWTPMSAGLAPAGMAASFAALGHVSPVHRAQRNSHRFRNRRLRHCAYREATPSGCAGAARDVLSNAALSSNAQIRFKTKPQIALEQLRWACAAGLPRGVVLLDAGYGANTDLRANITMLGLSYVAGILPNTTVWAPGTGPLPAKKWSGRGRPPKLIRRDAKHRRSRSRRSRVACPSAPGARSNGGKARPSDCPRALLACGSVSRIAITSTPTIDRKNGF